MSVLKVKNSETGKWVNLPALKGDRGERGPAGLPGDGSYSESDFVGNIGDEFYIRKDFAWSAYSSPQKEGTCRLYEAKAGDVFYVPALAFAGASYNTYYDMIWLVERDTSTITVIEKLTPSFASSWFMFTAPKDCYVLINEATPNGTRSVFNVYRNAFIDKTYVPFMFDTNTLLSLTDGLRDGLKGIVTTCNPIIKYEPGYYIAYTNGHETINFPNIVMIHGDIVYYDGMYFHHCHELTDRSTPVKKRHYNVVIIGSGASGIATALNLIGTGAKVAIIEKNHHLGGTHTCAGAIDLCASPVDDSLKQVVLDAWEDGYASIGTSEKFGTTERDDDFDLWWNGSHLNWVNSDTATSLSTQGNHVTLDPHYMQQYYYQKLKDGGVDVFLDTAVADVVYDGEYLRAVITDDGRIFNADLFVDAGDNIIMRKGGEMDTDYFYGYDGNARFNEDKVTNADPDPTILNRPALGAEVFGTPDAENVGTVETIYVPYDKTASGTSGSWGMPRKGTGHKYAKAQNWLEAHPLQNPHVGGYSITASSVTLGMDSVGITPEELLENGEEKTYAKYANAAMRRNIDSGTAEMVYCEPNEMMGTRESYRLNGVYNATQTDCETQLTELGNNSILSSWYTEPHGNAMTGATKTLYRNLTGIPIQTMFSPKFKNYINPSKGKGVSHLAHSTFRLMRTCWLSGRLAAEIIKLCWQSTLNVQNVDIATVNENAGIPELFANLLRYIEEKNATA